MNITQIVAINEDGAIGFNNNLVIRCRADLLAFKKRTKHNIVVMGRKTYESIGKALPDRVNIVITRDENFVADDGVIIINSLDDLKQYLIKNHPSDEIYIIGGCSIYEETIEWCNRLIVTHFEYEVMDYDSTYDLHIGNGFVANVLEEHDDMPVYIVNDMQFEACPMKIVEYTR